MKCFGLFEDLQADALGLVLEFVDGGTLRAVMESPDGSAELADVALR